MKKIYVLTLIMVTSVLPMSAIQQVYLHEDCTSAQEMDLIQEEICLLTDCGKCPDDCERETNYPNDPFKNVCDGPRCPHGK